MGQAGTADVQGGELGQTVTQDLYAQRGHPAVTDLERAQVFHAPEGVTVLQNVLVSHTKHREAHRVPQGTHWNARNMHRVLSLLLFRCGNIILQWNWGCSGSIVNFYRIFQGLYEPSFNVILHKAKLT